MIRVRAIERGRETRRNPNLLSGVGVRRCNRALLVVLAAVITASWATAAVALRPPPGRARRAAGVRKVPGQGPVKKIGTLPSSRRGDKDAAKIPGPGEPRSIIKADNATHDFGTVWVGPTLKHSFIIKNEGDATLEIKKVKPSCGCTIAGPYPRKIEPGETGEFPFSVASQKLRGKFEKAITVTSNDYATPTLRLRLRGLVKRYVEVVPPNVYFGKVRTTEPIERVVKITNNTEQPLELALGGALKNPKITAKLVTITPGQLYELRVTATPPLPDGAFRESITLKTNVDAQKSLKVSVRGTVPKRLEVTPGVLNIGSRRAVKPSKTKPLTRVVRFTNYGATPVKLLDATVDDPAITASVKERREGKAYTIQIEFPVGYTLPADGRQLTLKTDDSEKPSITVPIKDLSARRKSAKRKASRRPAEEMVGKKAPSFTLTTTEGKSLSSMDLKGNVTVIDFFAPNCGFCKKQMPRLEKIRAEYAGKGVRFVAVSQTMRNKKFTDDQIIDKVQELGFKGELAINHDNSVGKLFKATSYPTMVVLGKTGKIDAVNIGNRTDLEKRMKMQLDALIAGKPVPVFDQVARKTEKKEAPKRKRPKDLVGKPAPAFSFETIDGKKMSNAELAKHPAVVLNVVAPNCGYCKKQVPRTEKIRQQYAGKGVRFINVIQTMRKKYSKDEAVAVFKGIGSKLEVAYDPNNKVGPLFNATGFPTMIVLGKSGKVEAVHVGNVGDLEKQLTGQLDALITGKPAPKLEQVAKKIRRKEAPKRRRPGDLVGKPAPAFSFETIDGKKMSNAELAKHPAVVLNVVAPNCGYCKKQVPRAEKIRQKYAGKGVRFINVAQTMRKKYSQDEVVDVFKGVGSKLEMAYDPNNKVGPLFGATGFPTMIVLGKSGKVEAVHVGNISDLEKQLTGELDALIAGKPVPKFAAAARPQRKRPGDLVGKVAPAFSFETIDGKKMSNAELAKHPAVVLNVVAPNCGYCKKQVPRAEKIRQKYADKGVRFINVIQTMRKKYSQDEAVKVFSGVGSKLESAYDPNNKVGPLFNATGFPTMIVLGKSGKVEAVHVGNVGDLEKQLTGELDALIAGKPVPKSAKAARPQRKRPDALVGKPAPAFSFETIDGKKMSNAELAKHPAVVLNVVAPNCGYCKKQVPRAEKIRQEYAAKGVRFINVAQTMRKKYSQDEVVKVFDGVGSKLEMAYDPDNKVGQLFNATGFPTMIVLGKSGNVESVHVGNIGDLEKQLRGELDALIAGKPVPKYAAAPRKPRRRPAESLVGKPAPEFSLTTLKGKSLSSKGFKDHPATVLNFIAPNCGYCKKQLPNVEKVRKEYEAKGVRFVNVAQKMRKDYTDEQILDVMKGAGSQLELVTGDFGDNKVGGKLFKAVSFPTMIVVNREGTISHVNIGAKQNLESLLKGQLDALMKGKP